MIPVRDSGHDNDIMRNMGKLLFMQLIDSMRTEKVVSYL